MYLALTYTYCANYCTHEILKNFWAACSTFLVSLHKLFIDYIVYDCLLLGQLGIDVHGQLDVDNVQIIPITQEHLVEVSTYVYIYLYGMDR